MKCSFTVELHVHLAVAVLIRPEYDENQFLALRQVKIDFQKILIIIFRIRAACRTKPGVRHF